MNNRSGSTRLTLLIILGVLVLSIIVLLIIRKPGKALPETMEVAVPVSVTSVHLTNTADVVDLPAMIEANVSARLSAEKAGRIVDIKVDRGDHVKKGQLLLQIDDRTWQANLKQANIAARDAAKNYKRFETLQNAGAVAQSEFDRIEKAKVQAESAAEQAQIDIEQCRVESPIGGVINDRFVETGEYVQPGTPVFQVVDDATVKVIAQIPEKDIFAIHVGDSVNFTIQPLPDRTFHGKVTFVATQADDRNNSFRTEITVDNADGTLRPGMIAQVQFNRGIDRNMVSLPLAAVLPSNGDHIVYIARNGQAVRRQVQIDTITSKSVLISSGLEEGDQVIVDGNRTLGDGQRVEIMEPGSGQ